MLLWSKVASYKKLQEEEQIAAIHDKRSRIVFLFNLAFRISVVVVKTDESDSYADHHLRNLESSDNHWVEPLWAKVHCHQEIVAIHRSMYTVVHHNKEDARRRSCNVRVPAIKQNGDVMVPMEENERLLVNYDKESINKFAVDGKVRN